MIGYDPITPDDLETVEFDLDIVRKGVAGVDRAVIDWGIPAGTRGRDIVLGDVEERMDRAWAAGMLPAAMYAELADRLDALRGELDGAVA
ncbi:hypothetical protein [Frankia sp. Cj3]|uniref:hypothetical protein n=1 Tax=Frankia sp. Cj3 TaxID=2880976 RepID=UPI001EF4FCC6|nr:hypothetical protein [Frankia sp. Cj3]